MRKHICLKSLTAILTMGLPASSYGVGFRLPNQDPEAIARGNAFVATADNPSAIYYNPAGITQIKGQNVQAGLYGIIVNSRHKSPAGSQYQTEFEIQSAPQFYYTFAPREKPFAVGLGIYAPYGLGLEWPENTTFRTLALEARLIYASINPVVAWQVHPTLSLAIGPTLNAGRVRFRQGIFTPGDGFQFQGDGFGAGLNAGLLWKPHDQWSFGLSYRGPTSINFTGDSEAKPYQSAERTSAELEFPQYAIAGVSFRPNEHWNIEVDVDWADWDALDTVTFQKPSGDSPFAFNWRSSFMYELGVTRYLNNGYFVSGGYFFAENASPDKNFNPSVPDTDQHVFSLGLGHKGKRWDWALAYQLITGPWRTVSNSQSTSLIGQSADGRYKFFNNAVNVSVGYHF